MKKTIFILTIILIGLFIFGCTETPNNSNQINQTSNDLQNNITQSNNEFQNNYPNESTLCENPLYKTIDEGMITLDHKSSEKLSKRIDDNNGIIPPGDLDGMDCIEWISLHSFRVKDISELSKLTNLKILHLESNDVSDLSPLKNLTNLKELYLTNSKVNADISVLNNLKNLKIIEDY